MGKARELKMSLKCYQLKVLMWMHFISRKRKPILTIVELVAPIVLMVFLFILKNQLLMDNAHSKDPDVIYGQSIASHLLDSSPKSIGYYPKSRFTDELINGAVYHLFEPDKMQYNGYATESDMLSFISGMTRKSALIVFPSGLANYSAGDIPDKLEYTIRMKQPFLDEVDDENEFSRHTEYVSAYEPFMALQWAIDNTYLKLLYKEFSEKIFFQEFPFVKTKTSSYIEVLNFVESCCRMSLLVPFLCLMTKLVTFRLTGIQELLKINGVDTKLLSLSHVLNALPIGLVYALVITILMKISATPLVPNTNPIFLFLILILHFLTIIGFAFLCSYFPVNMEYLGSLAILMYTLLWLPSTLLNWDPKLRTYGNFIFAILPHGPLSWFSTELGTLETDGSSINFSTMFNSHTNKSYSVFMAYVASLIQLAIQALLVVYLNQVRPGPYGTARPYNFFWKKKVEPERVGEQEQPILRDPRFFQPAPLNKLPGIQIENVTKTFDKKTVLNDVSFDVYQGEITILLGHNGAGKTTLMSIITGLLSPTKGTARVQGMSVEANIEQVRHELGLCPQENQFIPDLNVLEHVMFFAMLKGQSQKIALSSSTKLLKDLNIMEKSTSTSHELSGGMKRRLQLACALAGGATTVILDEPTSGLDVETRRDLWDLLLNLRGTRTILLTTHFMEEADALADRVVVMTRGTICGHATSMHLKKNSGAGYRLTLTTVNDEKICEIGDIICSKMPCAKLKQVMPHSLTYNLPIEDVNRYPELFSALEANKKDLGIESMGVSMPTLEEVFLKLSSNENVNEDQLDNTERDDHRKLSGCKLIRNHIIELTKRNANHLYYTRKSFILTQVLLPIFVIFIFTSVININIPGKYRNDLKINLDMFKDKYRPIVLTNMKPDINNFDVVKKRFGHINFKDSKDIIDEMVKVGQQSKGKYRQHLFGMQITDDVVEVFYSTLMRYTGPVAINTITNTFANHFAKQKTDGQIITTHSSPIKDIKMDSDFLIQPKPIFTMLIWAVIITALFVSTLSSCASLPSKERVTGVRHMHLMCGVSPLVYWGTRLLFHGLIYTLVLIVPVVISISVSDTTGVYSRSETAAALFLTLLLGMTAWLTFVYWMSFYFYLRASTILSLITTSGLVLGFFQVVEIFLKTSLKVLTYFLPITEVFLTPQTLFVALVKLCNVARDNAYCTMNMDTCPPKLIFALPKNKLKECCIDKKLPFSYFEQKPDYPYYDLILLAFQTLLYMTIVYMLDRGISSYLWEKLKRIVFKVKIRDLAFNDQVLAEQNYVKNTMDEKPNRIQDALLVNNIQKMYRKLCETKYPVRGVSFSVKKGEIFGILGANGAGKSTSFKIIVAETSPTYGQMFSTGYFLNCKSRPQYMQSISYCAQFCELDDFMTCDQNLRLLLALRGFDDHDNQSRKAAWIEVFGLQAYKHKKIVEYSGGWKRRVSAAAALCVEAGVSLLDEPTTGVDVAARRRVWAALRRARGRRRALLLTSHSMDEMEELCDRIAILCDGEIRAIGSPATLRAQYGSGYTVIFNLTQTVTEEETILLKAQMARQFTCEIKDQHKTMLKYRITDDLPYSDLFKRLEKLKHSHPKLIEDYIVSETSLEEVFLSFAQQKSKSTV